MVGKFSYRQNKIYSHFFSYALTISLITCFIALSQNISAENLEKSKSSPEKQFTYSWPFADQDKMRPRGGTTVGEPVTLSTGNSEQWNELREAKSNKKEKDRRAILALAGDYRVSFDFIETIGFNPDYDIPPPYQSWGTEKISVILEQPNLIVLQHILEIHFAGEQRHLEPVVVKHWRQDWHYEDEQSLDYLGKGEWRKTPRDKVSIKGKWSQSVYQVDDSPRYEGIGKWVHLQNMSIWTSEELKRPLPRREFSVRDDYDFLQSTIRITVIPTGWIQEEDALKVSINSETNGTKRMPLYLAREAGLSRYELITDFDFSRADAYWERTSKFWNLVRGVWVKIIKERDHFHLVSQKDEKYLFAELFEAADGSRHLDEANTEKYIRSIVEHYLD